MGELNTRLTNLFLRSISSLARFRHVPVLGDGLSWISRKLVARDSRVWVTIQHGVGQGLWICVNPRTGYDVQQGAGERAVQGALAEHLLAGQTFYDLGANIGFFSLMAARLVGPAGRVISFEADPEIAERLRENLAYNKFEHAVVEHKAVWSEPGRIRFVRVNPDTSPDRGLGHVEADANAGTNIITVEAVSLDQYTQSHASPDFLKCDVEGAEVEVFRGAERLLREKRPGLLVEMHSAENRAQLKKKFEQLGYACTEIDENHVLGLPR